MTAPLMPFLVRLAVDQAVRLKALELEDAAYRRFRAACEFAKVMLARSALQLDGRPGYLVAHAGFLLSIRFDRVQERFLVVAFDDHGEDPEPPNASRDQMLYKMARIVGFDVGPLALVHNGTGFGGGAEKIGTTGAALPAVKAAMVVPTAAASACAIQVRSVAGAAVYGAGPFGAPANRVVFFWSSKFHDAQPDEPLIGRTPDTSSDP